MIKVLFFGTPAFAASGLEALTRNSSIQVGVVVTQPDKRAGRGKELQVSPVKRFAIDNNIPVVQPEKIKRNETEFIDTVSQFGPFDIGVVIAFGQILPLNVLQYPRHGCVNVHASILPRWRGAAPIQRAIMAGDTETGISLMSMDEGLDTGAVYCIEKIPITPDDTAGTIHDRLAIIGSSMLSRHLADIVNGAIAPTSQPQSGVTYAEKIKNEEAIIAWSKSASEVSNHIRGLSPFPGATSFLDGKRVKILMARPVASIVNSPGGPGTVSFVDKHRLEIQCGVDAVSLEEVQLEGRKRMPIEEFLRGTTFTTSTRFSDQQK